MVYDPKLAFFKDSCFSQETIDAVELIDLTNFEEFVLSWGAKAEALCIQ